MTRGHIKTTLLHLKLLLFREVTSERTLENKTSFKTALTNRAPHRYPIGRFERESSDRNREYGDRQRLDRRGFRA